MMYINIIILVLCINFALGLGHIEGTPITIPEALQTCYLNYDQAKIVGYNSTSNEYYPIGTGQEIVDLQTGLNGTGGFDPITEQIEGVYQTGVTIRNFLLGGYIVNVLDNISFQCVWVDGDENGNGIYEPELGELADGEIQVGEISTKDSNEVLMYFKVGVQVLFGFLLVLLIFYIITGKTLGYNL